MLVVNGSESRANVYTIQPEDGTLDTTDLVLRQVTDPDRYL